VFLRLANVISLVSLMACASPAEQAKQQAAAPVAQEVSRPIQFAAQNKCAIQGLQPGTDTFAQCVRTTVERQLASCVRQVQQIGRG
jgi:uncharacterized membrane protein